MKSNPVSFFCKHTARLSENICRHFLLQFGQDPPRRITVTALSPFRARDKIDGLLKIP